MTESEKTLSVLIALNSLVFIGWQIPRFMPFMGQWFLHLPGTKRNLTLLTSCFSHQEFFHFALNMVGLWSFGRVVHDTFGREQFLAMYLSAGVGANVVSHACSLALRNSRPLLPSLGASGAIYGLVASTAILHPNSSISLIFLPMIPIKLGYALPALMSFDLAGILLRWKMFDHFAHLAGAGLGIGYTYYGERHIWAPLVRKVHEIRENSRNGGGRGQGGVYMLTETQQRPETIQSQTRKWTKWF
ncbi:rhomboid-domain-containing protein [Rhizopus microsporus ATCC 52813]|uniref:Rhomboid-domain-containing protein n=2 Tax=Rhizopus microsporus TaxID=58291 RepID=A0A2G4SPG7_RHIZD|nr:rhomboid-domain-containing protein [Rhizopus microsporus ATCC 52813]PHZ10678.1 rhomboid-domain-containing protein [Rhizopus microsporus ATCC 52813]